ncbi:MAG: hypothetical protein H0V89_04605 [Deltaproteobacteria bacterium]|nr:hypothetical protein [Deltaproteobacteria bacterium]
MDYQALFARILHTVDTAAYQTPVSQVEGPQREALAEVDRMMHGPGFDATQARTFVRKLHAEGRLDRVKMLSALHVIACHPSVADWEEAARLVGEQEYAALELGGPHLDSNLASADRHRGVLAFLRGHHGVALEYFTRSLERERSAENLGNVLAALLRLGDEAEARDLLDQVRRGFPSGLVSDLDRNIARDPDLALLRSEAP